jgi:hypothetical protein
MAELKTKQHDGDVLAFIKEFANTEQKQEDSFKLIDIMQELSGHPAKMWGSSMIGFGSYHYKSDRSTQEGDWPLIGFSPRKAAISLYVFSGIPEHEYLLEDLGKFKRGKACLYINKLSDINQKALEKLILETIDFLDKRYGHSKH